MNAARHSFSDEYPYPSLPIRTPFPAIEAITNAHIIVISLLCKISLLHPYCNTYFITPDNGPEADVMMQMSLLFTVVCMTVKPPLPIA